MFPFSYAVFRERIYFENVNVLVLTLYRFYILRFENVNILVPKL